MIILIGGASHTGKTYLAQQLLEHYHIPYVSMDHLKMGLIRSGRTKLTPEDDEQLVDLLWPIVKEMIKTAIENHQHLIIEGCYIPADWVNDFETEYRHEIHAIFLVMSKNYLDHHFNEVLQYQDVIEYRQGYACSKEELLADNEQMARCCQQQGNAMILIDKDYRSDCEKGWQEWKKTW